MAYELSWWRVTYERLVICGSVSEAVGSGEVDGMRGASNGSDDKHPM